jgi:hypothetical protein
MSYKHNAGPTERYDVMAAHQFCVMAGLGLRGNHKFLDIGCGPLRGGRLFIPYLKKGKYYGIEPNKSAVHKALRSELGGEIVEVKEPRFFYFDDFKISRIGQEFDYALAQSIFTHATQDQIKTCISELAPRLRIALAATFFEGEEDYSGDTWVAPRAYYTFNFFEGVAHENNLTASRLMYNHPFGQKWILLKNDKN